MLRRVHVRCAVIGIGLILGGAAGSAQIGGNEQARTGPAKKRLLVSFRKGVSEAQVNSIVALHGAKTKNNMPQIGLRSIELEDSADEAMHLRVLRGRPEIAFAEVDRVIRPAQVEPNDPYYGIEWHLQKISAPVAWATTTGNQTVTVAILDTGVDLGHPDLYDRLLPGWNAYENNGNAMDINGHGTRVAGAAVAASNNGQGITSVAWNCSLLPVRVSDTAGNATYSSITAGLLWAADHGARVANISYPVTTSAAVTSAAEYFFQRGGVVTVAAGNDGATDPADDNPYMLTIGATDNTDALYTWSNKGNNIDLTAPGCVWTTDWGGGYSMNCGTSFSAPIVAGAAALLLSSQPQLTPEQLAQVLRSSADDFGPTGWDSGYGWGRINVGKAMATTLPDVIPPTVQINSPAQGTTVTGRVSIQLSAADDGSGLKMVAIAVDNAVKCTQVAAPFACIWDSTTVPNGNHTITATAQDQTGNFRTVSIEVTVGNSPQPTGEAKPVIAISSPVAGSTVSGTITISVSLPSDLVAIKAELSVDDTLAATTSKPPFDFRWNTRKVPSGAHTLKCIVYTREGSFVASVPIVVAGK